MPSSRISAPDYGGNVFINCPFDNAYSPLLEAILFAVAHCGFRSRCALEIDDSSQVRMDKILKIISECRFGGKIIGERYDRFLEQRPELCRGLRLSADELTFHDSIWMVSEWLRANT